MRDSKFMRGQIWWLEGYEVHKAPGQKRPALIVSNNNINSNPTNLNITVIPITSNVDRIDIDTNIIFDRHTRCKNIIKCAEVVTVYKSQLVCYESTLDEETMMEVEKALRITLGLEPKMEIEQPKIQVVEPKIEVDTVEEVKADDDGYEVEKSGSKVKWTVENEALFMQLYTAEGINAVAERFGLSRGNVAYRACQLRAKYPEFKKKKGE